MQKKGFIYWLFNKDKKPLCVDAAGMIQEGDATTFLKPDGSPAHLTRAPEGWRDTLIKYARNIKYLGLFRDFTVPMKFYKDGGKIIRYLKWNVGSEVICYLGISKLNRLIFPELYEAFYKGELDFSKVNQKNTATTINVIEGGLSKLLKAYEGTTFEIPIDDDPEAVNVVMDGLNFKATSRYETVDGLITGHQYKYVDLNFLINEGTTIGITNYSVFGSSVSAPDYFSANYFMSTVDPVTPHFKFNLSFFLPLAGDVEFWLHTQTRQYQLLANTFYSAGRWRTLLFDFDWPLLAGENVYLMARIQNVGGNGIVFKMEEFTVSFNNKYKNTIIKALSPARLWQRLVEKMSNGAYSGNSSFLKAIDDLVVTSAMALRNHEGDSNASAHGSKIKTSINDFFKSFGRYGIGLGIENDQLIIEKAEYFFKTGTTIRLGEVNEVEITDADDLIYNTIKVGYPNQTYDSVNGLDEFNVTQKYTTPLTRVVKELDLVSVYRADMYGIELIRVNLDGKNTTDNQADNDTFFLSVSNPVKLLPSFFNAVKNVSTGPVTPIAFDVITAHADVTVSAGSDVFTYTNADQRKVKVSGSVRVAPYDNTVTISVLRNGDSIKEFSMNANGVFVIDVSFIIGQNDTVELGINNSGNLTDIFDASLTLDFLAQTTYSLRRNPYTSVSGLLDAASAYNIELSPKRAFLNNGPYLRSMLHLQDHNYIVYQTGEKNSELKTVLGGRTIEEKSNIQISRLGNRLFLPYYFNFTTSVPLNFMQMMKSNPYDRIEFEYMGIKWYGYLFDGGIKPATNDKQQWKLLAAPNNDMTKLINAT